MAYCINCGKELVENAKFCFECGTAVQSVEPERKTTYEGIIHKCPNCGDIIDAYETVCEACGYEIRGRKATSSVQELADRLREIDARQMPDFVEKKSVMKVLVGKDFSGSESVEDARHSFERRKKEEKANLITNYPIPNTKEDIIEFFLLATSNIGKGSDVDSEISKAWIKKLDQIIEKAAYVIKDNEEYLRLEETYFEKTRNIKRTKIINDWVFL